MFEEKFDFYDKSVLKSYDLDASARYQLKMLDSLDNFTRKHSESVANLTCRICDYLHLNKNFIIYCTTCAYLHDIGKMFIPPSILQKPAKLTDEEFEIMKTHTTIGYKMCMDDKNLRPFAAGPRWHHEALNGSGYPDGLKGDKIPIEDQIIRVADEFDAIVSKRQYKSHVGITDTLKSGFITIVDFLFYDGKIAGHTFSELTTSAKLEVLKAALWVDDKIDSVFPGYKETISNGANKVYTSVKGMIVSTYLDITTSICSSHSDLCESAKRDFQSLKQSFGFTWDMIKDLASSGLDKLKNWYEIWSGK